MKRVSIKDIAEWSGFSIATVSRVINKKGKYSKKTEKKIVEIINEVGYQPNYSAKSLRGDQSYTIGILIPDITNYFFNSIVQELERYLFKKGYSTIITSTDRNLHKEKEYIDMLIAKNIDGLILISGDENFDIAKHPLATDVPIICIDRRPSYNTSVSLISSDHFQAAYDVGTQMVKFGVKHPTVLINNKKNPTTIDRIAGFNQALADNNMPFIENLVVELGNQHSINLDYKLDFILNNKNTDGIFALNDDIAALTIKKAKEKRYQIPDDLVVVGFDNADFCEYTSPTITSVRQNTSLIAKNSVDQLIKEIVDPTATKVKMLIPTEMIIRQTMISDFNDFYH